MVETVFKSAGSPRIIYEGTVGHLPINLSEFGDTVQFPLPSLFHFKNYE